MQGKSPTLRTAFLLLLLIALVSGNTPSAAAPQAASTRLGAGDLYLALGAESGGGRAVYLFLGRP